MLIGLSYAFLAGVLTIFFGAVFKHVGTKYDFKTTMLIYAIFTSFICVGLSFCEHDSWATYAWLPALLSLCAGAVNISGLTILQKAMKLGNAGVAWAFCQAGLLGPFFFSIICYQERPSILQYAGAFLIVIGMVILSGNDSEKSAEKQKNNLLYLVCALGSFCFACVNGSLGVATSKIAPEFSITVRSLCMYLGTVIMLIILKLAAKSYKMEVNKGVMKSVFVLAFLGIGSTVLLFLSLNYLSEVNLAGITIPIMQGTAIGGFALYGTLVLKEKCSLVKWLGIIAIILGIVFMSI